MEQVRPFVDERLGAFCYACHGPPATRDHVPARVFLDQPYPENLPVVGCCQPCNEGASADEEYVACLLELAACSSVRPGDLSRPKIARTLTKRPALAARLAAATTPAGILIIEEDRVSRVIEKIGRALWSYETGETTGLMSAVVSLAPLSALGDAARKQFLELATPDVLPEVGSRFMFRVLVCHDQAYLNDWQEVQAQRFSYAVDIRPVGVHIKMILRGYLAADVELLQEDELHEIGHPARAGGAPPWSQHAAGR